MGFTYSTGVWEAPKLALYYCQENEAYRKCLTSVHGKRSGSVQGFLTQKQERFSVMATGRGLEWTSGRILACWTLALYSLLVAPRLLSTGMFVDGVVYASIARNLAEGYGSFWRPAYTATVYPVFYEHPPLAFWLQSWAFWLCGDTPVVEAVWGYGLGLLIAWGMAGIWRCLTPSALPLAGAWWPVGLWVLVPMTSWALANNMLENTLTLCVVGAVWCCLRGLQHPRWLMACSYASGAALCLVAGVLTKGPVALFPLVVPGCWLAYAPQPRRRILAVWGIMLATCLVVGGLLALTTPAARDFCLHYGQQQLGASLSGVRERTGSRWEVLRAVSREIAVPLLLGGLLTWLGPGPRTWRVSDPQRRLLLCYLGIALAGSLPLMVSAKQHRWYVFPSLPFYVLALALLWQPAALRLEGWFQAHAVWRRRSLLGAGLVGMLALGLMGFERHALRRDAVFHQEFTRAAVTLPARTTLSVYPPQLATNWTLVANMQRFYKVSLTSAIGQPYLLTTQAVLPDALAAQYQPVPNPQARTYHLFHRPVFAALP